MVQPFKYIRFFQDLCLEDLPLVGGKNASLLRAVEQAVRICHARKHPCGRNL